MSDTRYDKIVQAATVVEWRDHPLAEIDNDRYFGDSDELFWQFVDEALPADEIILPRFMHPVEEVPLSEFFNAGDIVNDIHEGMFYGIEDYDESHSWLDWAGLSKLIHGWMGKQSYKMYEVEHDKVVDLKEFWEKVMAEEDIDGASWRIE